MIGEEQASVEATEDGETLDLNDATQVKARTKRAKAREGLQNRFLSNMLATPEGKEWVRALLTRCNAMPGAPETCHPHVAGDPYSTAFNAGAYAIGVYVIAQIPKASLALLISDDANG